MLHYKMYVPPLQTVPQKERVIADLKRIEPAYEKGNVTVTAKIAEKYPTASENARKTVQNLLENGLPGLEETDECNRWLCENCKTFSCVYEAIDYLEALVL